MRKTVECRSCELKDKGAQACEFCPERRESPLYKKPWFWILLLTAIAITAINLYQPSKESKNPESPKAFNGECNINVSASIDKSSTGMQELTLFITNLTGKKRAEQHLQDNREDRPSDPYIQGCRNTLGKLRFFIASVYKRL